MCSAFICETVFELPVEVCLLAPTNSPRTLPSHRVFPLNLFINDLENEMTCKHSFFADDVKLIAPRSQQHELRASIELALSWSRRWGLPLNASTIHHLSIGSHSDHRLVLSEEANGELMAKCEQIKGLGITVNSAFTPSANVLTAANKARGMLYFIKKVFYMPDEGNLRTSI